MRLVKMANLSINKEAVKKYMKEYWARLDEVTAKYIANCMTVHGYKVPKDGINDDSLKKFSQKLYKKNLKLMVFIVTGKEFKDFKGDTIIRKNIFCEILKKGVKLGTYKNMIIRRFPQKVGKNSTWEGCDYAQVYGLIRNKKNGKA